MPCSSASFAPTSMCSGRNGPTWRSRNTTRRTARRFLSVAPGICQSRLLAGVGARQLHHRHSDQCRRWAFPRGVTIRVSVFSLHRTLVEPGTSVWTGRALQAESDDLEVIGLALLYPALERNVCVPGHHGYPRASDLILGKALKGRSCHQITDATRDRFSISSFQLADLGGKAD